MEKAENASSLRLETKIIENAFLAHHSIMSMAKKARLQP